MSQNDFTLANQSFPSFRSDLNSALQALASNNSGATAPSTTFANMWWYDSANNIMYIRNEDNDAWIKFAELDQTNDKFVLSGTLQLDDGTVSAPALTFNSDTNMGIYRGGTDILKFVTAGTDAVTIDASQNMTLAGTLNVESSTTPTINIKSTDAVVVADDVVGAITFEESDATGGTGVQAFIKAIANDSGNTYDMSIGVGGNTEAIRVDQSGSVTLAGALDVSDGTIKLDGNYPTGTDNVALGNTALDDGSLSGDYNTAIGAGSLTANTTGVRNTAVGQGSLASNTTGERNTAVGRSALYNSTGSYNTAVGMDALVSNTSASNNTAVGYNSMGSTTTGTNNTAVGYNAGNGLTTGDYNVAIGRNALNASTASSRNVAIGYNALDAFTGGGTPENVAVGFEALGATTTGTANTAVGGQALFDNTTGIDNTAMGKGALGNNTTASYNTSVGRFSLVSNTTGQHNTAIGTEAGYSNTTSDNNTFIGRSSGSATTGGNNTFVGRSAGSAISSGTENTILGRFNGNQGGLDIRTGSNRIVLSDGDGNVRQYTNSAGFSRWTNNISDSERSGSPTYHTIHSDADTWPALVVEHSGNSTPNGIFIDLSDADPDNNAQYFIKAEGSAGTERFKVYTDGDVVNHDNSYGSISDVKLKEQITDASSQWEDIKALSVRKYKMKSDVATGDSDAHWRLGLIAQEVETAGMNGLIKDNPDMIENEDGEIVDSGTTTKSIKYSVLYMKAVKALQEAMERIETLEQKVATLEGA